LASPPAGSEQCAGVFIVASSVDESVAREIGTIIGHINGAMASSVMWLSHQVCDAKNEIVWLLDTTLTREDQWPHEQLSGACEQNVVQLGFLLIPRMLDLAMRLSNEAPAARRSADNGQSNAVGLGVAMAILFALDNHRINASFRALFGALARYVCAGHSAGRSLRSLILDTVSRILLEGCAKLPEQAQAARPH
jgi:hypothetical protein